MLNDIRHSSISRDYLKLFEVIAHDVKGPLEILQLAAGEMIRKKNTISEAQFDTLLNRFEHNLGAITALLNNLLAWARNNQEKIQPQITTFPLYHVAEASITTLSTFAEQKRIKIENQIDTDISVITDRDILEMVVRNLLSNAIKFSHHNSTVNLKALKDVDTYTLIIKDSGIGMNQALIQKIFDKEKILSKYGTSCERGTGLGLTICLEFTEKLGCQLKITSEEGMGSEISVCIPHEAKWHSKQE